MMNWKLFWVNFIIIHFIIFNSNNSNFFHEYSYYLTCHSKIYKLESVINVCATKGMIDNLPYSSLLEAYYLCFTLGGALLTSLDPPNLAF